MLYDNAIGNAISTAANNASNNAQSSATSNATSNALMLLIMPQVTKRQFLNPQQYFQLMLSKNIYSRIQAKALEIN